MPRFDLESYVQVKERVAKFRSDHPLWALRSEIVAIDSERVVVRAWIEDETGRCLAVGHAEEIRDSTPVNKTSPLENGETSAWGRALANLGYEVDKSIASREDMEKVERAGKGTGQAGGRAAPAAERSGTPAPPPAAQERARDIALGKARDDLWAKVDGLSRAEKEQLKGWLVDQKMGTDFDSFTAEQVTAVDQYVDSAFGEPF